MTESRIPIAVVTGGTRGLGRALVFAFARAGFRVYTTARGEEGLAALDEEVRRAGLDVVTLQGDVARTEDNARLAQRIGAEGHQVDVLVHSASLLGVRAELADYPLGTFDEVLAANLRGPFDLTKQLLPLLRTGAAVQFVTSGVSVSPRTRWGAYEVSKTALDRLAQIWAKELADDGIRVYLVNPGPMRTAMRRAAYPDEDPATLAPPEERVDVFLWLAREADASLTGSRFEAEDFAPPR